MPFHGGLVTHRVTSLATLGDAPVGVRHTGAYVPHVVAWNLTRRCNLECAHCYISAGPSENAEDELSTDECRRITDEILSLNPNPMFILSGGEPLLREDLTDIASYAATRGATVVVGTNGTLLTSEKIQALVDALAQVDELQGFVWTQLTDIQQEINGLLYFNRTPKLPLDQIKAIFERSGDC